MKKSMYISFPDVFGVYNFSDFIIYNFTSIVTSTIIQKEKNMHVSSNKLNIYK